MGKARKRREPEEDTAPAPTPAAAQPSRTSRRLPPPPPSRSGGISFITWVLLPTFLLGVLPICVVYLPFALPQREGFQGGKLTMVGGAGAHGAHGLFNVLQEFGTDFCAEHGARDTVKCHLRVLELAYHMFVASEMIDFYTTVPQAALRNGTFEKFKDAKSPVAVSKLWTEVAVDPLAVNPSQVAYAALQLKDASKARLRPVAVATLQGQEVAPFAERVAKVACYAEFRKVFGTDRVVPLGEGGGGVDAIWAGKTVVYVFGMEAALAVLKAAPAEIANDRPVNIVILPLLDSGVLWLALTRGRSECDPAAFAKSYDSAFHFFTWVTNAHDTATP